MAAVAAEADVGAEADDGPVEAAAGVGLAEPHHVVEEKDEGTAGGGVVTAQVTASRAFHGIKLDPSVVDPDDVEMLEDLITAAIQDAMTKAAAVSEEKMSVLTGGLKLPGLS